MHLNRYVYTYKKKRKKDYFFKISLHDYILSSPFLITSDDDDNVGMDDHDRARTGSVVTSFFELFCYFKSYSSSGVFYWFFFWEAQRQKMRDMRKSRERSDRRQRRKRKRVIMYVCALTIGEKGSNRGKWKMEWRERYG